MHRGTDHQAKAVDRDMSLSALISFPFGALTRPRSGRGRPSPKPRGPPLSVVFTLALSIAPA
jgi:hypothetical protein